MTYQKIEEIICQALRNKLVDSGILYDGQLITDLKVEFNEKNFSSYDNGEGYDIDYNELKIFIKQKGKWKEMHYEY